MPQRIIGVLRSGPKTANEIATALKVKHRRVIWNMKQHPDLFSRSERRVLGQGKHDRSAYVWSLIEEDK